MYCKYVLLKVKVLNVEKEGSNDSYMYYSDVKLLK